MVSVDASAGPGGLKGVGGSEKPRSVSPSSVFGSELLNCPSASAEANARASQAARESAANARASKGVGPRDSALARGLAARDVALEIMVLFEAQKGSGLYLSYTEFGIRLNELLDELGDQDLMPYIEKFDPTLAKLEGFNTEAIKDYIVSEFITRHHPKPTTEEKLSEQKDEVAAFEEMITGEKVVYTKKIDFFDKITDIREDLYDDMSLTSYLQTADIVGYRFNEKDILKPEYGHHGQMKELAGLKICLAKILMQAYQTIGEPMMARTLGDNLLKDPLLKHGPHKDLKDQFITWCKENKCALLTSAEKKKMIRGPVSGILEIADTKLASFSCYREESQTSHRVSEPSFKEARTSADDYDNIIGMVGSGGGGT